MSNDNLPAFATLTNDNDRQRKAKSAIPGTYSVVVTPESFINLPEYASSGSDSPAPRLVADHGQLSQRSSNIRPRTSNIDDNTVVLDQFEENTPPSPAKLIDSPGPSTFRSTSSQGPRLYDQAQMSSSAYRVTIPPITTAYDESDKLAACFNRYIVYLLIPWVNNASGANLPNLATDRDFIEEEARQFLPVSRPL